MKALTKISIGFLALAAVALWFTSCSSEDVASGTNQGKMSSLTLTINTGKSMGSRATGWTADPASNENDINRITVGIFSSDGNTLRTIVELAKGDGTKDTFKPETKEGSTSTSKTIVTNSLTDGDLIKVAVNAPQGHFVGVKTASEFQNKSENATEALTANADETKEACNNNVPMYGEGTLTPKNSGNKSEFIVSGGNVTVKHMLAKVSLESLGVDFKAGSAYANAEFTPVAAFLINVPDKMDFTTDVWNSSAALLHGWSAYDTSDATNCTFNYAAGNTGSGTYAQYLTTENLTSATALSGTSDSETSKKTKAWFYTLPNDKVDDGNAVTQNTKLVIAGKFKENTGSTAEMVYYSLPINATYNTSSHKYEKPANGAGSAFQVCPNQNYKCSVTIRTKGSSTPNTNLTPQAAEIEVKVTDFVDVTQSAEFN